MTSELFNVVVFDPDGFWHYRLRDVPAKDAVDEAKRLVWKATNFRAIDRILITDSGDDTAFLWERGRGVVHPPLEDEEERTHAPAHLWPAGRNADGD